MENELPLPEQDVEAALFDRMQSLDRTFKLGYGEIGLICREVEVKGLWRHRIDPETGEPCTSMNRWIRVAAPWGYSKCYTAMDDVKELIDDVPASELASVPQSNFPLLRQLSTAVRADPKVLHAAQTERAPELAAMIRSTYPSQHLEPTKAIRFVMDESAAQKVEEALAMAETRGAKTRQEQLEMVAVEAMQTWSMEAEVEAVMRREVTEP